jgi:1,4-alpha-glucan branching enzyme
MSSAGVYAFGRDFKSAQQVWCATRGYPGDPLYRDFYRDIGFDLPGEYISSFTHLHGIRTFTGIKYHRVTGRTEEKLPYDRVRGMERASEHARHFIRERAADVRKLSSFGVRPVLSSAFDAELFGHWWFEGVAWLDNVLRNAAERSLPFRITTPGEYLSTHLPVVEPPVRLAPSSWGEGGFNALWIGNHNRALYRHLHAMAERMEVMERQVREAARKTKGKKKEDRRMQWRRRALRQATREMLLAQSSDWLFLMEKGRAAEYAENRIKRHIERFNLLFSMVQENSINESWLERVESVDRIFPWLDGVEE